MTGPEEFERQALSLGLPAVARNGAQVSFELEIPDGSFAGQKRRVGAEVPGDFPVTPPGGPHINPATVHSAGAVHASSFGAGWVYWSRPVPSWATDRSLRAWLRHVRSLFAQV
jgi:hypothetical protein